MPYSKRVYSAAQFRYLVGTRHHDDEEGGDWETMRVIHEGDNVVVYRRQVIGKGTKLARNEDGPIFALDVAHMTKDSKQRPKSYSATWTDSDSDGYSKRDDSDSDGDGDGLGRSSKANTSSSISRGMQEGRASDADRLTSGTTQYSSLGSARSAVGTSVLKGIL